MKCFYVALPDHDDLKRMINPQRCITMAEYNLRAALAVRRVYGGREILTSEHGLEISVAEWEVAVWDFVRACLDRAQQLLEDGG